MNDEEPRSEHECRVQLLVRSRSWEAELLYAEPFGEAIECGPGVRRWGLLFGLSLAGKIALYPVQVLARGDEGELELLEELVLP